MTRVLTNTIGFDDGPFEPEHRGDVDLIGAVYSGLRLDGASDRRGDFESFYKEAGLISDVEPRRCGSFLGIPFELRRVVPPSAVSREAAKNAQELSGMRWIVKRSWLQMNADQRK